MSKTGRADKWRTDAQVDPWSDSEQKVQHSDELMCKKVRRTKRDGRTDVPTDERIDRWTYGRRGGWTDGRIDGRTDRYKEGTGGLTE